VPNTPQREDVVAGYAPSVRHVERPGARPGGLGRLLVAGPGPRRLLLGFGVAVAGPVAVTVIGRAAGASASTIRPAYALAILLAAAVGGLWPGLASVAGSFAALQLWFLRPEGGMVLDPANGLVLVAFLAVALAVAWEEAARSSADLARRRLAFLARAHEELASSLDFRETLRHVAQLAVPALADWCGIEVRTEEGRILEAAAARPERLAELQETLERYGRGSPGSPVNQVLRSGEPILLRKVPEELLQRIAQDEEHLGRLRRLGLRSAIVVPLRARGRVAGVLFLAHAESGRKFGPHDLAFTEELARAAGTAIENARLYEERSRIARTLQSSLLPPSLPAIPGLEVEARYRPTGRGTLVGGDFYDLFEAGPDDWALVMGDVCGKGTEAAALTGLVRHTVRATAVRSPSPSEVLRAVNDRILREGTDRFCTVTYARFHRQNGALHVTASCGGHPPPLVVRPGHTVQTADCLGTLLGVVPEPQINQETFMLQPGDLAVFYTDGVTEEYERAGISGEGRLVSLLWEAAELDAAGVADRIYKDVVEFSPGPPRDDMALVVVRVPLPSV
jgi:serine phosphatase RsbU (regulator of sigma subunit)